MSLTHPYPAEPIQIIRAGGSEYEIGRSHALQVGDRLAMGMPRFYYDFWKRIWEMAPPGKWAATFAGMGKRLLDRTVIQKLLSRVPESARDRLRGMAEASGVPFDEMLVALILPDLMPMLQAYLVRLRPGGFVEPAAPPRFGCTSFVWSAERFLHGRNLDFPGVAYWDRYPVIQVTEPKGGLRYLSFASAGVPFAITAVNEAQVSVSLHQHYCRNTSLQGELPFLIAERVMREARSAAEAEAILKDSRVASAWAFVVTDGKNRDAFVFETDARHRGVRRLRPDGGPLTHANFFQCRECQPGEYATTQRMNWDNFWRNERLRQLLGSAPESLGLEEAVTYVSDNYDGYWGEEKYVNRTVSQVYNIQSLVLDPERMVVAMAEGAPPLHLRDYVEFDLGELFSGGDGRTGRRFSGFRFQNPDLGRAKEHYTLSFIAAFDGRHGEALRDLEEAGNFGFCCEVGQVAGVMRLKSHDFPGARQLLERAVQWVEDKKGEDRPFPPEYFEAGLYLARSLDLLGERAAARRWYDRVAGHPDQNDTNLRRLARPGPTYRKEHLARIVMPYSTYIPFV